MPYRRFLAGLAAGSFAASAALAQAGWVEIDDNTTVEPFDTIADRVDDWDVYDAFGNEIGEVEKVVGTSPDSPMALVVDFDGAASYPDRDVVVPLSEFTREEGRLILGASPDAVGEMEVWND